MSRQYVSLVHLDIRRPDSSSACRCCRAIPPGSRPLPRTEMPSVHHHHHHLLLRRSTGPVELRRMTRTKHWSREPSARSRWPRRCCAIVPWSTSESCRYEVPVRPTSCNSAASARGRAAGGRPTDALVSLQLLVRRRSRKRGGVDGERIGVRRTTEEEAGGPARGAPTTRWVGGTRAWKRRTANGGQGRSRSRKAFLARRFRA